MLKQILFEQLNINAERELMIEGHAACEVAGNLFILIDVTNSDIEQLRELYSIAAYLKYAKEKNIWELVVARNGDVVIPVESKQYCLLKTEKITQPINERKGLKLARFHNRGRMVPFSVKKINQLGMWKTFWENRLEQMERVWTEQINIPPENDFERMFLEAFPYYMGLTENAIQYLADTEIDDNPVVTDSGTICHFRLSDEQMMRAFGWKNPFSWVLDHCSRDLAEWTRSRYFQNIKTYHREVQQFFIDYQTIAPLSSFSWRLLYARLLFPVHFFDSVEEYYITPSEGKKYELLEKFKKMLDQSDEYERFLSSFFQLARAPVQTMFIPHVEWLKKANV